MTKSYIAKATISITTQFLDLVDSVEIGQTIKVNSVVYELIDKFEANTAIDHYDNTLGYDVGSFVDENGNKIHKFYLGQKTRIFIITCNSTSENYNRHFYELKRK